MTAKETAIGRRIKECRQKMNLTQEHLAEILQNKYGLSTDRPTISKWETGFQEPTITPLKYMAEVFGVSLDYLNGKDDFVQSEQKVEHNKLGDDHQWLFDKIAKADSAKAKKMRQLMELVDGEDKNS